MQGSKIHLLSDRLKNELSHAYFTSITSGRTEPLIDFYRRNAKELKDNYGIDLNELLNIDEKSLGSSKPKDLESVSTNLDNSNSDINNTDKKDSGIKTNNWAYALGGVLAAGVGVFLIVKTLNK